MQTNTPQKIQKNIFDDFGDGLGILIEKLITNHLPLFIKGLSTFLTNALNLSSLRRTFPSLEKFLNLIECLFKINKLTIIDYSDTHNTKRPPHPFALGFVPKKSFQLLFDVFDNYCNSLICGGTGTGKTVFLNTLINRAAFKGIPHVVVDPKGDMDELIHFITMNKFHKREFLIFTVIKGFKN